MADKITFTEKDACIAAIRTAMPNVSQTTLDDIGRTYEVHLRYPDGRSADQIAQDAVSQVTARVRRNLSARKWTAYKNLIAENKVEAYIKEHFQSNPYDGLFVKMMGTHRDVPGARDSAMSAINSLRQYYSGGLVSDLMRGDVFKKLAKRDGEFDKQTALELENMDKPSVTGNPDARKAAEIIHKWQEKGRIDANDAGASIGKLDDYGTAHTHDMYRIRDLGRTGWKELIVPKLDWKRIEMGLGYIINDRNAWLDNTFDGISTGDHLKHNDVSPPGGGRGGTANALSHDRVLHFKPGEWFEYNQKAGARSLMDNVMFSVNRTAMSTGLMRVFGPSATHTMQKSYDSLTKMVQGADADKIKSKRTDFENSMRTLTGDINIPRSLTVAQVTEGIKTFNNITDLGGSAITAAFGDPLTRITEMRYQGEPVLKTLSSYIKSEFKRATDADGLEVAKSMGLMFEGMASHYKSRFDADGDMMGQFSDINALFFKANLLTPHTDRQRMGTMIQMGSAAAERSGKTFAQLPSEYRRLMTHFNIEADDWDVIRKGVEESGGNRMVTVDSIDKLTDDQIREVKGADLSDRQVRLARTEVREKYHSFLIDRLDMAVLRPDQRTQVYQTLGTQSGTYSNMIAKLMMQYKGYPIAFIHKVMARELHGRAEDTGANIAMRFGGMFVAGTLLGYGIIVTKALVSGKEPPDLTDPETLKKAALIGGATGLYGDVILGDLRKGWGRGLSTSLMGPTIGTVDDLADLSDRMLTGDAEAADVMKTVYRQAVPNIFYIKPALDYAIYYNLMEVLDPGSVGKMERRFRQQNERDYWLSPSETIQ